MGEALYLSDGLDIYCIHNTFFLLFCHRQLWILTFFPLGIGVYLGWNKAEYISVLKYQDTIKSLKRHILLQDFLTHHQIKWKLDSTTIPHHFC